ncbi:MAG: hypothetical protein FWE36_01335 [Erysipelotrichales bacterium]|nr:hypothetical protein [Erysipelotrichales bacterium]
MQELLKKFCLSEKQNGLLLIDTPTGTGKTYNAVDFIYNNYNNCKGKIIYVTNLKKNLPIKDLKDHFQKNNQLDKYEKDFLFLDNNVDNLIDNFQKIQDNIPNNFFKGGIFQKIKQNVSIIKTIKKDLKENKNVDNSIIGIEHLRLMMQQAKEELKDKYEKEFRNIIEQVLHFDDNKKKRTKSEKLKLIKNHQEFKWIGELYPSVYTDEKKIIFMSIDKLLVRNATLIEPSYQILDNKNLFKNSWLFIDEFDTSKDVILRNIINDSIKTKMGIIDIFRAIYNGYSTNFSKTLTETSNYLSERIAKNEKKMHTADELLSEFLSRANGINKKYKLINYHKLEFINKDKANFLFQDHRFHTILNDQNTNIYIENDEEGKINWIKNEGISERKLLDEENIFNLLHEINSFLTYFQHGVKFLADNYFNLKKERTQETNNFSYEASIKTVLSEFGIEGKFLNYLATQIMNNRKKREYKINDLKNELDMSVYEKGFRYYHFVDSDIFDTQSRINYLSFNITPEKIIIYLSKITKLIGISASGTLETVTGNYDINYIKSKISTDFYDILSEDLDVINEDVQKKLGNYENINIKINRCDITDDNFLDRIKEIGLSIVDQNYIIESMEAWSLMNYVKSRYVRLFYAMNHFFDKDIKSYIFMTNVIAKQEATYSLNFIQSVFKKYKAHFNIEDAFCYFLDGSLEKFENQKENIKLKLKLGKRVFLVSSYQTLGAGQNLQYEYDTEFTQIEEIHESQYGLGEKDFDAIFLDKPTNLFVNLKNTSSEEDLIKFIYQVKSLEQVGYYKLLEAEQIIKTGFKIVYHNSDRKILIPKSKHISMHSAKIILQAIGRICRTKNKNRDIFITFDCNLEKELANVKEELLQKPLNQEFRKLLEACNGENNSLDNGLSNINNSKAQKCNKMIYDMMKFSSPSNIVKWEELREIVLKYPTDNFGIHNQYDIYCEFDKPVTSYYYCRTPNYDISTEFGDIKINEQYTSLDRLMEIPEIKSFFIANGYATKFEESKYMLLPPLIKRIYLGALGEVIGEYQINRIINNFGKKLERITNIDYYEKFDFTIDNKVFIDFKHWSGAFDKDRETEITKVSNKLNDCKGEKAIIINILKPKNFEPMKHISKDNRITIIPYLYDLDEKKWSPYIVGILKDALGI